MEKIVIIMRGVPGSGKTNMANYLAEGKHAVVCSTDSYFVTDGKYDRDHTKLRENHQKNLERFIQCLLDGIPLVICDNTNIRHRDFENYVTAGDKFGYRVAIVTLPHPDPEVAAKRNLHNVPVEAIRRMIEQWEP